MKFFNVSARRKISTETKCYCFAPIKIIFKKNNLWWLLNCIFQMKTETSFFRPIGSFDEWTQVTDKLSSSLIHRCPQRGEKGARGAGGQRGDLKQHKRVKIVNLKEKCLPHWHFNNTVINNYLENISNPPPPTTEIFSLTRSML